MTNVHLGLSVFNDTYIPHLNNLARTQIFFGGSSSGKSVFLAQRCVYDLMQSGRNYLVCRAVGRTIRGSVYTEIIKVIFDWGVQSLFKINKSEMTITCTNGYQVIFAGLDDVEKLKSLTPTKGAITDIWVEEATETAQSNIKQLFKRQRGGSGETPKRLTMSFNPILRTHWIFEEYFAPLGWADDQTRHNSDDLTILKTTYRDNHFLTDADKSDLEGEADKYYYEVYTLGNWGVLGNVIFNNWEIRDLSDMAAQFTNRRNGLDFGFSSDPAALSRSHYDRNHKTIYIFDELYERGLTNDILAQEVLSMCDRDPVMADSAEPKSIAELQRYGVNIYGARKGKDSVLHGIQWLQQQHIIIDKKCINTQSEFRSYKWKEDRDGNAMRQPVDKNNHIIDGLRYAYEQDSTEAYAELVPDPFAGW